MLTVRDYPPYLLLLRYFCTRQEFRRTAQGLDGDLPNGDLHGVWMVFWLTW